MTCAYPDHPHPTQHHYLQHVDNGGEYHMPRATFAVNGFLRKTNTVYKFHSCFWHSCPSCYPTRDEKDLHFCDHTMQDVKTKDPKDEKKMTCLCAKGYNIIDMWEYEWTHLKQTRPDIQVYVTSLQFVEPLNPRTAFCGGRTNAIKLYHHVQPNQKIRYIDYTSLYPWVNKMCVCPKGHPQFISQPGHTDINAFFGFGQCQVLPHVNCITWCSLTVMEAKSPFLSVPPVCKTKWTNSP